MEVWRYGSVGDLEDKHFDTETRGRGDTGKSEGKERLRLGAQD